MSTRVGPSLDAAHPPDASTTSAEREVVRVHRRQFIVGPEPARIAGEWISRSVEPGVCLTHCPELRVEIVEGPGKTTWALLGFAAQTIDAEADPRAVLAATSRAEIVSRYESWAGRWALIGAGKLHPDATAMLGCYYGRAADGAVWASSSPVLLARLLGDTRRSDGRPLRYEKGLSWHPPPASAGERIARLLPSQILDLSGGVPEPRRLLPALDASSPYHHTLDRFASALVTAVRRAPRGEAPIWVSLSAGADSRVVFAAAHAAGVPLRTFTRVSTRMSVADYVLPPQLAAKLGHDHVYLARRRRAEDRIRAVTEHAGDSVSLGDAEPLIEGHRDELEGILLGGQCFGVGKVLMRHGTDASDADEAPGTLARVIARSVGEPEASAQARGLRHWIEWMRVTPVEGLDWRDRFYLEQRLGGWQSAKEQLYDMSRHERYFPINCARTYSLLLSLDPARREGLEHHLDVLRRLAPPLAEIPINPPDHAFGLWRMLGVWTFDVQAWRQPRYLARRVRRELGKRHAREARQRAASSRLSASPTDR